MIRENQTRVLDIFSRVVTLPVEERNAILDAECGDGDTRVQVEKLLSWDDKAGDEFLEEGPFGRPIVTERPGTVLGKYTLVGQVGVGGMSVVWLARQSTPVQRLVAVKIVKPGMDTRTILARFELERQFLVHLNHPNIASVLDAGKTEQDRPYFVMEYVEGTSLTQFCDAQSFEIPQRLQLFMQVCQVVHYAHQKGVIHRDIKPSNIMVTVRGDTPTPKVIDFGIAKATAGELTPGTEFTEHGQLIGTPEYMSPEQCNADPDSIDIRTDVYSLGVVLYELLCGHVPYDLSGVAVYEVPRVIRERSLIRPSTSDRRLAGDIETILLKALEKRPEDRYQSAAELARDIQRFLNCQPIEARPRNMLYHLRLFSKRHRVLVTGSAAMMATLIGAVIVSLLFAAEARRERDAAIRGSYAATIAAAEAAYSSKQFGRLRSRLQYAPESERGWEWRFLLARSDSSMLIVKHDAMVNCVGVSPDGSTVVTGANDGLIHVRRADDWTDVQTMSCDGAWVQCVGFGCDGERIVSGSNDGLIRVWRVVDGSVLAEMRLNVVIMDAILIDNDRALITTSSDHVLRCWDVASGKEIWRAVHSRDTYGFGVSADESVVVTGDLQGVIRLWDAATGRLNTSFRANRAGIRSLDLHPDGALVVSSDEDGHVRLWDVDTAELIHEVEAGTGAVCFSPDGSSFALGSPSPSFAIDIFDTETFEHLGYLPGHSDNPRRVTFSPDGARLYSGSWDRTLRCWDMEGELDPSVVSAEGAVRDLSVSPDGRLVASATGGERVVIRDAESFDVLTTFDRGGVRAWSVEFDPVGSRIAVGWTDGVIELLDTRTGGRLSALRGHDNAINTIAFSPDGTRLVTSSVNLTAVMVWDLETESILHTLEAHTILPAAVAFSSLDRVATCSGTPNAGRLILWDARTGEMICEMTDHESRVYDVAFSSDGRWLASGSRDQTVRLWDGVTGKAGPVLSGHGQFVTDLEFSPNDDRLVAGSYFQTLTMWDGKTFEPFINVAAHDDIIWAIDYFPDGRSFVSGGADETIRLWDERSRNEILRIRREARARLAEADVEVERLLAEHGDRVVVADVIDADATLDADVRSAMLNALLTRRLID